MYCAVLDVKLTLAKGFNVGNFLSRLEGCNDIIVNNKFEVVEVLHVHKGHNVSCDGQDLSGLALYDRCVDGCGRRGDDGTLLTVKETDYIDSCLCCSVLSRLGDCNALDLARLVVNNKVTAFLELPNFCLFLPDN